MACYLLKTGLLGMLLAFAVAQDGMDCNGQPFICPSCDFMQICVPDDAGVFRTMGPPQSCGAGKCHNDDPIECFSTVCRTTTPSPTTPTTTTPTTTTPTTTTPTTTTPTTTRPTTRPTTQTTTPTTTPKPFVCSAGGRFPYSQSCTKYWMCVPNSGGGFAQYLYTCSMGNFSPASKVCTTSPVSGC